MFCPFKKRNMEYIRLTVLCSFLLYSKVIQLYIHIYISPLFWISFPFRSPQSTKFPVLTVGFHICFIHTTAREPGRGQVWQQRRDTFHCILHGFLPENISPGWTRDP